MSVEFSNAYQEILLDNLIAIIKQNFVFQTQLKLTENSGKQKLELESQIGSLVKEIEMLKIQSKDVENYRMRAEQNTSAHEEKSRIQSALNDTMKQLAAVKKQLEQKEENFKETEQNKNKEIVELKEYIKTLEENVPQTKMKKINPSYKPPIVESVEQVKVLEAPIESVNSTISSYIEKPSDGSSF